jgi:transposase InsO family protein
METTQRKKLGKIGTLTKENAPDWFRMMESHLRGERLWKVIQDVIDTHNRGPRSTNTTPAGTPSAEGVTPAPAETPEPNEESVEDQLNQLASDDDWDAKNWKAITEISLLLDVLDRHTVQAYRYAGEIWTYLRKFYKQTDRSARMIAMRKVFSWQKDSKHSVKQAGQEIRYLADRIHQLGGEALSDEILEVVFLNGLPKEYENSRQLLEFHAKDLDQMIESLSMAESRMKGENGTLYGMDIATESARRSKAEWIKTAECYNCGEVGHLSRTCKKPKKARKNDENSDSDDEKTKDKKKANGKANEKAKRPDNRAKKTQRQRARAAKEDLESASDSDEDSEACLLARENENENETAKNEIADENAYQAKTDPRWVIDSGATAHCTDDKSIFESITPRGGRLTTAGGSLRITGKGDVKIDLGNGFTARLAGVLMVPGIGTNLLSTQALLGHGIESHQRVGSVEFHHENDDKIIAKGSHEGKTSYLTWVQDENALYTETARRVSERKPKKMKKAGKKTKTKASKKRSGKPKKVVDIETAHRRFGHLGAGRLTHLRKTVEDMIIKDGEFPKNCSICIRAKKTRVQNHEASTPASKPGERIYMDFWGPYRHGSITGDQYILTLTDDYTRRGWIFTMKSRSFEELIEKLEPWIAEIERELDCKIKRFRADNAKEFKKLAEWLKKKGIIMEFSTPYTPEQVGVAERMNRTLLTIMRALLFDSGLPRSFWPYAADAAVYIRNRTVKVRRTGKTPYELWTGKKLNLSNMRIWGRKCWIYLPNEKDKLNPRAEEGIFIGYTDAFDQYLVFLPEKRQIVRATNPRFVEDEKDKDSNSCRMQEPLQLEGVEQADFDDEVDENDSSSEDEIENEISPDSSILPSPTNPPNPLNPTAPAGPSSQTKKRTKFVERPVEIMEGKRDRKPSAIGEASQEFRETQGLNITGRKIRPRRNPTISEETTNEESTEAANLAAKSDEKPDEKLIFESNEAAQLIYEIALAAKEQPEQGQIPLPKTLKEAIGHPIYGPKWKEAVENEITNLAGFNTWKLVKRTPGMPVVSCKWVFLVKYGTDGRPERFKARLVARGFTQQYGIDYENTFAPVIRFESLRILLALAARFGWIIHLMDAQNAYLNSELDKTIYMEAPEGVEHLPGEVCELLKSIYGLKQSANLWNKKIIKTLRSIGFKPTLADASVFTHPRGIIVALYVDDMLILAKSLKEIERVKNQIKKAHIMKDLGAISKILGIHVTHQPNGSIKIDQNHYIQQVLVEFGMEHAKKAPIPLSSSINLENQDTGILQPKDHEIFRQMIGKMMFMAIGTRIDIALAVNRLSQYLSEPREVHLQAAKHVLRYLLGAADLGILYSADGDLAIYADAAYANARKFKSTTGFCALISNGPVTWTSRRQSVTAQSTTESEYIALADAAKQTVWLRHFLYAVGKPEVYKKKATTIFGDNKGSLELTANPVFHSRTKHIQVRYHAIRDFVEQGEIELQYIPTDAMLADGLTKALDRVKFERMIKGLGLTN